MSEIDWLLGMHGYPPDEWEGYEDYTEIMWERGFHKTKDGKTIKIMDMETSHIKNCIRYFEKYDTSAFQRELERRNIK